MTTTVSENNKRIAKNSLLLYFRMFLVMGISLFTSRVVLQTLGVRDFGIYNVVGGVIVMMNVLNSAMAVSTQRYLTFEQSKGDSKKLQQTFSICMTIFLFLSFIVFILGETFGLWFVNTQLVIPNDRIIAANWVYQFSLLSCIASLLANPYNASIISHEQMNLYAYVGIVEVVLKLLIVYLLLVIPLDRLAVYGGLLCLTSVITTLIYRFYCLKRYEETHYVFYWDKKMFKQISIYSGWNLFGAFSGVAKGQGLNILINIFFGPSVNASRGISYQVNSIVSLFFSNFYMAVRPQITKYYAQKDKINMFKLVFASSKMAFFLIMFISLPLILVTPYVINLWLGQTPEYVVPFVRIIIIITAIDSMSTPLMTAIHATGNNRLYQVVVGGIMIMTLPISYFFLKLGYSPISVFVVSLILSIISLFVRLLIAGKQLDFPFRKYIIEVVLNSFLVAAISSIAPLVLYYYFYSEDFLSTLIVCFTCILSFSFFAYKIGLNNNERMYILSFIKSKLQK